MCLMKRLWKRQMRFGSKTLLHTRAAVRAAGTPTTTSIKLARVEVTNDHNGGGNEEDWNGVVCSIPNSSIISCFYSSRSNRNTTINSFSDNSGDSKVKWRPEEITAEWSQLPSWSRLDRSSTLQSHQIHLALSGVSNPSHSCQNYDHWWNITGFHVK